MSAVLDLLDAPVAKPSVAAPPRAPDPAAAKGVPFKRTTGGPTPGSTSRGGGSSGSTARTAAQKEKIAVNAAERRSDRLSARLPGDLKAAIPRHGRVVKSAMSEEEKLKRAEQKRLLREANRGSETLQAVSRVVKEFEKSVYLVDQGRSSSSSSASNNNYVTPRGPTGGHTSSSARAGSSKGGGPSAGVYSSGRVGRGSPMPPSRDSGGHRKKCTIAAIPDIDGVIAKQRPKALAEREKKRKLEKVKPVIIAGVPQPVPNPPVKRAFPTGGVWNHQRGGVRGGRGGLEMHRGGGAMGAQRRGGEVDDDEDFGDDDDDDDELNGFIDDAPLDGENWRQHLRTVTGYDPGAYGEVDKEEAKESSFDQQTKEERESAAVAQKEDAMELKRIQEEEEREAARARKKRKL